MAIDSQVINNGKYLPEDSFGEMQVIDTQKMAKLNTSIPNPKSEIGNYTDINSSYTQSNSKQKNSFLTKKPNNMN